MQGKRQMTKTLAAADLFCGTGGSSTELTRACEEVGLRLKLIAVNHWDVAIQAHSANHPGADHYCASLDLINPRELVKIGKYYGTAYAQSVDVPLGTVTSKDRFELVEPVLEEGEGIALLDIRFRMLQPYELAAAMSFPRRQPGEGAVQNDHHRALGV